MIKTEFLENDLIRTYSDAGFYIHGGFPEADYAEAIDPVSAGREYTETDVPIEGWVAPDEPVVDPDEATIEDYQNALAEMGVSLDG